MSRTAQVLVLAVAAVAATAGPGAGAARAAARSASASAPPPATQRLAVLLADHVARTRPSAHAHRIESVATRRPLTRVHTVLPVLGSQTGGDGTRWLHVRLPGRPSGHTGWIAATQTRRTATPWAITVRLALHQVTVWRDGRVERRFRAIVGKPSTPTPRGTFFVEEALRLSSSAAGGPYALATSARSSVLQEFDGGPGQIALHGLDNLGGTLGTAVSHGCVRLSTPAITWLAGRIGAGVVLTVLP
ncbi:MAG TPA: L,D-transpeptidase [Baekduia sp.]|jgi:lipoprotein-anchoring transpeptidase ErfK/SrfK